MRRGFHGCILALVALCADICLGTPAHQTLLSASGSNIPAVVSSAGPIRRSRIVQVQPQVMTTLDARTGPTLKLDLFADAAFDAVIDRASTLGPDTRAWHGRLAGIPHGTVTIVLHRGTLAAAIHAADRGAFEIRPAGANAYVIQELRADRLTSCGGALDTTEPKRGEAAKPAGAIKSADADPGVQAAFVPPAPLCDDGSVIDLLVVYTQAAVAAAGGVPAIEALINLAVADTNDALNRSQIDTSIQLVHTQQVTYTESGLGVTDATRLFSVGDGYLDDVLPLRDQYGADCVSLWVSNLNSGGVGYFPDGTLTGIGASGMTVMRQDNAAGLTLAHELGHNLWCAHDRANAPDPPYADYSYGYREPANQWHDIMAYPPGFMIPYFANPNVNYPGPTNPGPTGVPVGQPLPCDLALTINQTRIIVANFRATAVAGLPSVLYVKASAPPGGSGLSWATAINDVQQALCKAGGSNGAVQEIWVSAGTYKPTSGSNRSAMITLVNGIALYGGFAGTETLRSQRNPAANVTTLSGDIGTIGVTTDNCYHVVNAKNTDATAILDGFTITGGRADAAEWPNYIGGGLYVENGTPTLVGCTFDANYASGGGGGIAAYLASPTVTACTFQNNDGGNWGGGAILNYTFSDSTITDCTFQSNTSLFGGAMLVAYSSSPSITGCSFAQNTVAAGYNAGGGIYCLYESSPSIQDCTFTSNTAQYGGAMALDTNCHPAIINCTFTGNAASSSGGAAGACNLYSQCSPSFTRCTFTSNTGNYSGAIEGSDHCNPLFAQCTFQTNNVTAGGGVMSFFGVSLPTFDRCTFGRNQADWGGVLVADDSSPTFLSCLFAGNSAGTGGAAALYNNSAPTMINCTITGNTSPGFCAGFYAYQASPIFRNSILWANTDPYGVVQDSQVYYDGGTPDLAHCMVQGWTGTLGGVANHGANPLFANAAGPDTLYGTADDNPRPQPGSLAINTGDNAALPLGILGDLDGGPRLLDGTVDRGVYEFVPPLPADLEGDGDVDIDDLLIFANCATGPKLGPPGPGCTPADLDSDNDVDMVDFARMQRCLTGQNEPGNPTCTN